MIYCNNNKLLSYSEISKTITKFNNPIITLSELESLDKKF